jgi:hypothetical protein
MAIKVGFDWLVKGNADMETYQNTLAVVLGSQAKATETLAWAQKFAAQTPFEIPQVVEATTRMASYGLVAKDSLGIIGDMASVMGKDLMSAVEAVADAQTGEVERLKEFGITKKMIQDQAKDAGLKNPINNAGQITDIKAFNTALFSLMNKRYKGGMDLQSKTFLGMLSNAKDFMGTLGRDLGKPIFDSMKNGLGSLLVFLQRIQSDGTVDSWVNNVKYGLGVVGGAFTNLKNIGAQTWHYITYLGADFYAKNKPLFDRMGIILGNLFKSLQTNSEFILGKITNVLIPSLINILFTVGQKVLDVAAYFINNWRWIGPLVEGITIVLGSYLLYLGYVKIATGIATAAQWLWNIAMGANPIGLVILGIGLLIGVGILLYQNWDLVKTKASDMWVAVENAFKTGVNAAIGLINSLITMINKIPGVNVPLIAKVQMSTTTSQQKDNAKNSGYTDNWAAGYSKNISYKDNWALNGTHANGLNYVPFDGYRAELHKGEGVLTAEENQSLKTGAKTKSGSVIVQGPLVGELTITGVADDTAKMVDKFLNLLYEKLKAADSILGTADMEVLL